MKPRTRIQKEVDWFSREIEPATDEMREYAINKLFKHYMYKTKDKAVCFACGHEWTDTRDKNEMLKHKKHPTPCPKCHKPLYVQENYKRRDLVVEYIQKIETVHHYQVVRTFYVDMQTRLREAANYDFAEVVQHWIRGDGSTVVRSIGRNNFGYGGERWQWGQEMQIRANNNVYYIYTPTLYPDKKILPIMRRNGYKGSFHYYNPTYFFELILNDPKAETLLKAGQINLFSRILREGWRINEYWRSIKLAIRNGYVVKDAGMWLDHLHTLEQLGKDILNPSFALPHDLKAEHNRLTSILNAKQERERIERERQRREEEIRKRKEQEESFYKSKAKFFDLKFANGKLVVVVLKSIDEFKAEGDAHGHCVFTNAYFGKEESLILSARAGKRRLETIEVDLNNMTIEQSRGRGNKPTPYHDQIIKLVEANMTKIKKRYKIKEHETHQLHT